MKNHDCCTCVFQKSACAGDYVTYFMFVYTKTMEDHQTYVLFQYIDPWQGFVVHFLNTIIENHQHCV